MAMVETKFWKGIKTALMVLNAVNPSVNFSWCDCASIVQVFSDFARFSTTCVSEEKPELFCLIPNILQHIVVYG